MFSDPRTGKKWVIRRNEATPDGVVIENKDDCKTFYWYRKDNAMVLYGVSPKQDVSYSVNLETFVKRIVKEML